MRHAGRPARSSRSTTFTNAAFLVVVFAAVAAFAVALIWRHNGLKTNLFDLGYYTQTIWNTAHGDILANSLKHSSFLGDHFSPILILLAPLMWVFPGAECLLVVQALCVGSAVLAAWPLVRRFPGVAIVLALAIFASPFTHSVALQEFHEIAIAIPVLVVALLGYQRRSQTMTWLPLLCLMLVREDMVLYIASFAVFVFAARREWIRSALLTAIAAVVWYFLATRFAIPAFGNGTYAHTALVESYFAAGPEGVWARLSDGNRLAALGAILLPLVGLPLMGRWSQVLWAIPLCAMILSPDPLIGSLKAWHAAPLLPILVFSCGDALDRFSGRFMHFASVAALICSLLLIPTFSPIRESSFWTPEPGSDGIAEIVKLVPAEAKVVASSDIGAHLAGREHIKLFPWHDNALPHDFLVLNTRGTNPYPLTPAAFLQALAAIEADTRYGFVAEIWGIRVYENLGLERKTECQAIGNAGDFVLCGFEVFATSQKGQTRIASKGDSLESATGLAAQTFWRLSRPVSGNVSFSLRLVDAGGAVISQADSWPTSGSLATSTVAQPTVFKDWRHLDADAVNLPRSGSLRLVIYDASTLAVIGSADGTCLTSWHDWVIDGCPAPG